MHYIVLCMNTVQFVSIPVDPCSLCCSSGRLYTQVLFHLILCDHTLWHIFLPELFQLSLSGYYCRIQEEAGGESRAGKSS